MASRSWKYISYSSTTQTEVLCIPNSKYYAPQVQSTAHPKFTCNNRQHQMYCMADFEFQSYSNILWIIYCALLIRVIFISLHRINREKYSNLRAKLWPQRALRKPWSQGKSTEWYDNQCLINDFSGPFGVGLKDPWRYLAANQISFSMLSCNWTQCYLQDKWTQLSRHIQFHDITELQYHLKV